MRLIYGIRRSEHITDALIGLHWLRVPERILFKIAVTTYRALNVSVVILYPCHWRAIPAETSIGFFKSACYPVVQPFHRRKTGISSFRRQLLEQSSWKTLPSHVTYAPSLAVFRQRLETFLFHLSYPDLIIWLSSYLPVDLAITFVI